MKISAFVIVLFVLFSASAEARQVSGFIEEWNTITKSGTTPEINVYLAGPVKGMVGWTSWSIVTEGWSESMMGLTLAPAKWLSFEGIVGIETDEDPLRGGVNVWAGKGKASVLFIQEYGGSGYWYRCLGTYEVKKGLSVGVNSMRYSGTGPYLSKSFGKMSLWGVYAIDKKQGVLTARLSF